MRYTNTRLLLHVLVLLLLLLLPLHNQLIPLSHFCVMSMKSDNVTVIADTVLPFGHD